MNDHEANTQEVNHQSRRLSAGVVAGMVGAGAIALAVTIGGLVAIRQSPGPNVGNSQPEPAAVSPQPLPSGTSQATKPAENTAEVYWLRMTGNVTKLVPDQVSAVSSSNKATDELRSAFNRLLAGPRDADNVTTIPAGTTLRSLRIEGDSIRIDLSKEFTSGGGTASMTGRLAQVIYTATSIKPNAKVWIYVEGKPLETLGGEGLELEQPMTRKSFNENFPL